MIGGEVDESQRYIAPTVLRDCKLTDAIMQEEVTGLQLLQFLLFFSYYPCLL